MDPVTALATASSITSLLHNSGTILSKGYEYLLKVIRGPKELRLLLNETAALDSLLDELRLLVENGDEGLRSAVLRLERVGTLTESKEVLKIMQIAITKCRQEEGHSAKNFGRRLLWPFKERETKELLQRFHRLRATFTSALSIDTAAALRRIEPSIKKIEDGTIYLSAEAEKRSLEIERASLISWLSYDSIDVENIYEDVLSRRQTGTNAWFFDEPSFTKWRLEENSIMWIYGIPGTGKTVLSSTVIEHLRPGIGTNIGLIFFFHDHRDPIRQSLRNFIGNGIRQLLQQDSNCIKHLKEVYDREKKEAGGRPTTGNCLQMLKTLTLQFETVYIVVDALDECREMETFLDGLKELRSSNNTKTNAKILITSRQEIVIERQIQGHLTCSLSLTHNTGEDIRRFLTAQVQRRTSTGKLKVRDPALRDLIITAINDSACGMFLWASIQLERICDLRTDRDIKRNLKTLPIGLDGMYIRILGQIQKQGPEAVEDVKKVFQWLIGSFHPVPLEEIAEALAIQPGDVTLDQDGIANDIEDIAQLCGSLVTMDKVSDLAMSNKDKATPIAFAHMSIPEFLRSDRIKQSPVAAFHIDMPSVHAYLARICVQYLSFSDFEAPCTVTQLGARTEKFALLWYASQHWMNHLKASSLESQDFEDNIMPYLQWFLGPASRSLHFQSWTQIFRCAIPDTEAGYGGMQRVPSQSPLFYALLYGVELLLDRILLGGAEVNQLFVDDWTPLHIVAYAGHPPIAGKLLSCGANVHAESRTKRLTPLHIAAEQGYADIVRLLLLHQADPHSRSSSGSTPFYRAPRGGSLEVLKILQEHGSDVNATTWDNWNALHEAVVQDDIAIVKMLLEWGTDPSTGSINGDTPLTFAQGLSRWDIARLLIEFDSMRAS